MGCAFAALAVITHHYPPFHLPKIDLGRIGVTLFFVLSGFLISRILLTLRESSPGVPRSEAFRIFYARRALRILPLYYAILLATTLLDSRMPRAFTWHAFYLSNIKVAYDGSINAIPMNHFWSLAVEEQFYLVWPALLLLLPRSLIPRVLLAIVAVGPISRLVLWYWSGTYETAMFFTTSCLDALGLGAMLAWIRWSHGVGEKRSGNDYPNLAAIAGISGLSIITIYKLASNDYSVPILDCRAVRPSRSTRVGLDFFLVGGSRLLGFSGQCRAPAGIPASRLVGVGELWTLRLSSSDSAPLSHVLGPPGARIFGRELTSTDAVGSCHRPLNSGRVAFMGAVRAAFERPQSPLPVPRAGSSNTAGGVERDH